MPFQAQQHPVESLASFFLTIEEAAESITDSASVLAVEYKRHFPVALKLKAKQPVHVAIVQYTAVY